MPGPVRPRESYYYRRGYAGNHVCVGDDQAVISYEAGAGGGVAALGSAQNLNRRQPAIQCHPVLRSGWGTGFGAVNSLTEWSEASTSLRTVLMRSLTISGWRRPSGEGRDR